MTVLISLSNSSCWYTLGCWGTLLLPQSSSSAYILWAIGGFFFFHYLSPLLIYFVNHSNDSFIAFPLQSVFALGTCFGGLSSMFLNDWLGRKLSIMFSALPAAIGFLLMGSAQHISMLLLGRILTGLAGGLTSSSIPVSGLLSRTFLFQYGLYSSKVPVERAGFSNISPGACDHSQLSM